MSSERHAATRSAITFCSIAFTLTVEKQEGRRFSGKFTSARTSDTVIAVVSQLIETPPFGMPADQLRAKLFVEISKLEEDILRQSSAFQNEAYAAEALAQSLDQIQRNLRAAAVSGGQASLVTRRRALKSGS